MRHLLSAAVMLAAAPAFAHEGLHLHPHGIDAGWAVLAASALVACGIAVVAVHRK